MDRQELIDKYNPANAANLNEEDLNYLRQISDEELKILAEAYPNQPNRKAYLTLYDKNVAANKQLYQLSTYQNLYNVRKFANKKNLTPFGFRNQVQARSAAAPAGRNQLKAVPTNRVSVDLSPAEAAAELKKNLDGGTQQKVSVTNTGKGQDQKKNQDGSKKGGQTNKANQTKQNAAGTEPPADEEKDESPASDTPLDEQFGNGGTE